MGEESNAVLLVDADIELHAVLTATLAGEFPFFGAKTLELGLRIAARRAPAVAILDARLAEHGPDEVVAALRSLSPGVRVVFLTSTHDRIETTRLTPLGSVMVKPIDPERLKQVIRNVVRLRGMSDGVERLRVHTGQLSTPPRGAATMSARPTTSTGIKVPRDD